jgi:hypothetical protein
MIIKEGAKKNLTPEIKKERPTFSLPLSNSLQDEFERFDASRLSTAG